MGGGSSTSTATPTNDQLSSVLPTEDSDPTPEELKAAEEANEALRQGKKQPAATSETRQRQAIEATELEDEFAASVDEDTENKESVELHPLPLELNFQAVKEIWFQAATGGRGRSLVELKDTVTSLSPLFSRLFRTFTALPEVGMNANEFVSFVQASGCDADQEAVGRWWVWRY